MIFPSWVPESIAKEVIEYQDPSRTDFVEANKCNGAIPSIAGIWLRLTTRPEMELVWRFISGRCDRYDQISLVANGGLLGTVNRRVRSYCFNPKLSPKGYKEELHEIASMAEALSRKLKKFTDADRVHNSPIPFHSLLTAEQTARARRMMHEDVRCSRRSGRDMTEGALSYYLPPVDLLLLGLSARAKVESVEQFHRIKVPRKINDKNAFRTYFIRMVVDYFFMMYADYSPSRMAIFCSVALDDADITPDLVRKLCPLDEEQKAMLEANSNIQIPED